MTSIYVLNQSFELVTVIDEYVSSIWTTRFLVAGEFELYLSYSNSIFQTLHEDYYLVRQQDFTEREAFLGNNVIVLNNVMIIEKIHIKSDIENGTYITVTGSDLKSLLKRRVIWGHYSKSQIDVSALIYDLLKHNIADVSTTQEARRIPLFNVIEGAVSTEKVDVQYSGENLGDTIETLCTTYNIGYEIYLLQLRNKEGEIGSTLIYFRLTSGIDRSSAQTERPYVEFSMKYDNLAGSTYSLDKAAYKNVALIGGEGEGESKYFTQYDANNTRGIQRREVFIDAPTVSLNTGEVMTDSEYYVYLEQKGREEVARLPVVTMFEGAAIEGITYKFNKDYFLGDTVQVVNEFGIKGSPQILEAIENENENGRSLILTFSKLEREG